MPRKRKSLPKRIALLLFVKIPLLFVAVTFAWVLVLKWVPVWTTPLMIQRKIEFREDPSYKVQKKWVPYRKMSPELAMAAIASEDNRFDTHNGFDMDAIEKALEEREKTGRVRGASTISQQTAKNVFCIPSRSYVRKAFEAYFTVLIEWIWGKERIMEVYLNVAEMGKGIYGAQAAAKTYFSTDAALLGKRQSCLIVACLPLPLKRNPAAPSQYVSARAYNIAALEGKLQYPDWVYHRKPSSGKKN